MFDISAYIFINYMQRCHWQHLPSVCVPASVHNGVTSMGLTGVVCHITSDTFCVFCVPCYCNNTSSLIQIVLL